MADTPIELPVIDISNPHDPAVGKAMLDAAAKYGFLYVNSKCTDFTVEDVDRGFELVSLPCGIPGGRAHRSHSPRSFLPRLHKRRKPAEFSPMCVRAEDQIFDQGISLTDSFSEPWLVGDAYRDPRS